MFILINLISFGVAYLICGMMFNAIYIIEILAGIASVLLVQILNFVFNKYLRSADAAQNIVLMLCFRVIKIIALVVVLWALMTRPWIHKPTLAISALIAYFSLLIFEIAKLYQHNQNNMVITKL